MRLLFIAALAWLAIVIFLEAHEAFRPEAQDSSRAVMLFVAFVFVAGFLAVLLARTLLPKFAESVANFFFAPNQKPEKTPHTEAMAAVARGDYRTAIAEYGRAYEADRHDHHAVLQIARLYAEQLDEPRAAIEVLELALRGEWAPDKRAWLLARLAQIRSQLAGER